MQNIQLSSIYRNKPIQFAKMLTVLPPYRKRIIFVRPFERATSGVTCSPVGSHVFSLLSVSTCTARRLNWRLKPIPSPDEKRASYSLAMSEPRVGSCTHVRAVAYRRTAKPRHATLVTRVRIGHRNVRVTRFVVASMRMRYFLCPTSVLWRNDARRSMNRQMHGRQVKSFLQRVIGSSDSDPIDGLSPSRGNYILT